MANRYEGRVAKIPAPREGKGKRGAWFSYSFAIEAKPKDVWYNLGFNKKPSFSEGDFVQFDAEENENGYLTVVGEVTRAKNAPAKEAPAKDSRSSDAGRAAETGAGSATSGAAVEADRQTQIVLQHSQDVATRVVDLLLRSDALPTSEAKSKAGTAKRFDEILASVDKLTVKYFKDVVTARVLSTVVDMGVVSVKADGPIPDAKPSKGNARKGTPSDPDDDLSGQDNNRDPDDSDYDPND